MAEREVPACERSVRPFGSRPRAKTQVTILQAVRQRPPPNIGYLREGAWGAVGITHETASFLMHNASDTLDGIPTSVLIRSVGALLEELDQLPIQTLERLAIEIVLPRGSQPVSELWSYEHSGDNALHYAFVSRDGTMEPCHPAQPPTMTRLKRKFVLNGYLGSSGGAAVAAATASTPVREDQVVSDQDNACLD